jgi:hypothetical protein
VKLVFGDLGFLELGNIGEKVLKEVHSDENEWVNLFLFFGMN